MNPQVTVTHSITITLPGMEQPAPLTREQATALRDQLIEAVGRPNPPPQPQPQEKKPDADSKRLLEEYRKQVEEANRMPKPIHPPLPIWPRNPWEEPPWRRGPQFDPDGPWKGPMCRISFGSNKPTDAQTTQAQETR